MDSHQSTTHTQQALEETAPLTPAQERLWKLESELSYGFHTFSIAYHLTGSLDETRLRNAVRAVASRHPGLSVVISSGPDGPRFLKAETSGDPLECLDVRESGLPVEDVLRAAASARLDLEKRPGWRCRLFRQSETEHHLLLQMHHVIGDRWSVGVFMKDLGAAYQASGNGAVPVAVKKESFASFASIQQKMGAQEPDPVHLTFWRGLFASSPQTLVLPTKDLHATGYRGGRVEDDWDQAGLERLAAFGDEHSVGLFATLLAGFCAFLHASSEQRDLIICIPVIGRHRGGTRDRIGYYNNILPLRISLDEATTFHDLVQRVGKAAKDAFTNQEVWFQTIASLPEANGVRLSRCLFSVQNIPGMDLVLPGVETTFRDIPNGTSNFDVSLFVETKGAKLHAILDYKDSILETTDALQFLSGYRECMDRLLGDPGQNPLEIAAPEFWAHNAPPPAISRDDAGAKSVLEERLITIWESLFQGQAIHALSDFFALGGDSMQAAAMFARIEKAFNCSLPLATLMEAPTIRLLADRMADSEWVAPWKSLVPIKPAGSKTPLFCIHGGGGNVFSFRVLAEWLDDDQPVYGLQARGLGQGDKPLTTVEDMAEHYLECINRIQPEGPYCLSGHSLGAVVAYEMAQRLRQAGKEVALLALLDHPGPDIQLNRVDWIRFHVLNMSMLTGRDRLEYVWRGLVWRFKLGRAERSLKRKGPQRTKSQGSHAVSVMEASMRAIQNYTIRPYPGKITLFRARMGSPRILADRNGGWGRVAGDGVEIHEVPGTHMKMFRDPHVQELGQKLATVLRSAGGDQAANAG